MKFSDFDEILENWSKQIGLITLKQYQDNEVRSWEIVDDDGNTYQIWIELHQKETIRVCCCNKRDREFKLDCSINSIQ
jgi:hypothetical protein